MTLRFPLAVIAALFLSACAQEASSPGESAAAGGGSGASPAVTAPVVDPAEVAARVAVADAELGKRQYIFCQACHTTNPGGSNKVGPNLSGIIDSPAGQGKGFVYSAALAESGIVWDIATMDSWIESPNAVAPGTTMIFGGIKDPAQRANLIAYLQQVTAVDAGD